MRSLLIVEVPTASHVVSKIQGFLDIQTTLFYSYSLITDFNFNNQKFDAVLIFAKMVDIVSSLMRIENHARAQKHVMEPDVNIAQEVKCPYELFSINI